MLRLLEWLSRKPRLPDPHYEEYDPVYGFSRRAVEEWLARNPRLRERHKVEKWLALNPPLLTEYETALQERGKSVLGI